MIKKKKIYFWSVHIDYVATINSIINTCISLKKFEKDKYDLTILNAIGEWEEYNKELGTKRSPSFASLAVRREGATLSRADVSDAASARQRFLAGGAGSDAQRKEDIRALTRVRDAVEKNTTQYDQANKIIQTSRI